MIEPFLRPGVTFPHGYTFGGHPPLTCGQAEFDEIEQILRHTLLEAQGLV